MRKLLISATVAGLGLFGCKAERQDVAEQREDVAEARSAHQDRAAELRQEEAREVQEVGQDTQEELADSREEVINEERELAETQREAAERAGVGGSGLASPVAVTGTLKSSLGSGVTLTDKLGGELKLDTDDQTVVMHNGQKVEIDDFEEGSQIRASYVVQDDEKVAREITILRAAPKKD